MIILLKIHLLRTLFLLWISFCMSLAIGKPFAIDFVQQPRIKFDIIQPIVAQRRWTNSHGKQLIVLLVPNRHSSEYITVNYESIFNALVDFAKAIIGKDNIVVIGGNESIPLLKPYLPNDILLETEIDGFWLRDFTPIRGVLFKFVRDSLQYGAHEQKKLKKFVARCTRQKFLYESPLVTDGGNIMHNDFDKGIMTSLIFDKNALFSRQQVLSTLYQELKLPKITIIPKEMSGESSGHVDLSLSFIDRDVVVFSDLTGTGQLKSFLRRQLGPKVKLVQLNSFISRDPDPNFYNSACGLHVNILVTEKYLYVPIFSGDQANIAMGQTAQRDWENVKKIAANTRKIVVPISMPFSLCKLGGNTRCLSWSLRGPMADDLIYAAQLGKCPFGN